MGGRLVLVIKDKGKYKEVWEERLVVQEYIDKLKHLWQKTLQHASSIPQRCCSEFLQPLVFYCFEQCNSSICTESRASNEIRLHYS